FSVVPIYPALLLRDSQAMCVIRRRDFLISSFGGLAAAALPWGPALLARESPELPGAATAEGDLVPQRTLFLTWRDDPPTTMPSQWVDRETTADMSVRYAPLAGEIWQTRQTLTRPFPNTDLRVYRCELTGLAAGAEYKFEIGKPSPLYRFRT